MAYLALYGTIGILRTFCEECELNCLVVDDIKQCCDKPIREVAKGVKRMTGPIEPKRRYLKESEKEEILEKQDYRCTYCEQRFGATVFYKLRETILKITWDHVFPFVYTHNNDLENFVACCHICNSWKRARIFNNINEVKVYVTEKWQRVHNGSRLDSAKGKAGGQARPKNGSQPILAPSKEHPEQVNAKPIFITKRLSLFMG
jgi:DNA-directed RNA polymerase subunit RPC12/RpoP